MYQSAVHSFSWWYSERLRVVVMSAAQVCNWMSCWSMSWSMVRLEESSSVLYAPELKVPSLSTPPSWGRHDEAREDMTALSWSHLLHPPPSCCRGPPW